MGCKVSCTLGEVKNRADLIIYWGGNPAECHPRHFTKYTLTQKGKFVPKGRKDRTMVLVDIRETPSAKAADIFLQIRPGKDFEVLTILRALIKNQRVNEAMVAETGLSLDKLREGSKLYRDAFVKADEVEDGAGVGVDEIAGPALRRALCAPLHSGQPRVMSDDALG